MIDLSDNSTIDMFPKKRGRPVSNPEVGPMSPAQRQAARRAALKKFGNVREVYIDDRIWAKLCTIAERSGKDRNQVIGELIKGCRLPRKS